MSVTAVPIRPLKKGSVVKLWLGIIVLVALAAAAAWFTTQRLHYTTTSSGLQYRVVRAGEGPNAGANDYALVEYAGRLEDGTEFDSSRGQPVPMQVSGVVPGFSEALQLMNKGSSMRVRIPPALGYGPAGAGGGVIPPNATLEFDITLVDFRTLTAEQRQQLEMMQMMQQQGGMPPGAGGEGAGPPGSEGAAPPGAEPSGGASGRRGGRSGSEPAPLGNSSR
jgi:FKBP-type peptidyl-prolyl cis-trans isomerase FkpA